MARSSGDRHEVEVKDLPEVVSDIFSSFGTWIVGKNVAALHFSQAESVIV